MTVYLVGAGPGDPALITLRGAEVLGRADVVVYDRLAARELLELAPETAERIFVGKSPGRSRYTQEEINELLVTRGRRGEEVVRLKGGDPFVFARGGEEMAALVAAGVPFEVVPGVSSAIAVPAYAGVPVTMRHSSTLFTVITGHEDPSKDESVDWETVAKLGGTIVLLMGAARLGVIAEHLLAGGAAANTPVVAVTWGTTARQRTLRTTLEEARHLEVDPPVTIVIGRVAEAAYPWFESKPLFGKTIVVCRPRGQQHDMSRALRDAGARVLHAPLIEITDPPDGGKALRECAERVSEFDWVAFTSRNGVERFMRHVRDARDLAGVKVAAIGPATGSALRERGVEPDLVARRAVAESLAEDLIEASGGDPGRLLLPRAVEAREVLVERLRDAGWEVHVVAAYKTVHGRVDAELKEELEAADVVCFTSSSTVRAWTETVGRVPPVVACIGPVTAETARAVGMEPTVVADEHTAIGLVDALVRHFGAATGRAAS